MIVISAGYRSKVKRKWGCRYLIALLLLYLQSSFAQPPRIDIQQLQTLSSAERSRFIHDLNLEALDFTAFLSVYRPLLRFAREKRDWRMEWDLRLYYYRQLNNLKSTTAENIDLLIMLEEVAVNKGFEVGQVTARHFLSFDKYYADQLTHEALYVHILKEYNKMKEMGFEAFSDYYLVLILYSNGRFMYQLGDLDIALQFFNAAEQFTKPIQENAHDYILVMNHLQTIHQKRNDFKLAIEYAHKILNFTQSVKTTDPEWQIFYRNWHSLTSSDVASMLVKQGKYAESKPYVQKAYELTKTTDSLNKANPNLEYDALQVLTSVMLEMNELEEATPMLQRLNELYAAVGRHYENYFNNIKYFECRALYHELKGEYAKAIHYTNLAKPLKDSLSRRNDARQLEQFKQRLKAEEYTKKIQLIEQERKLQKWLRNAAFVILALVLLLTFLYFQKLHRQRQRRIAELETAKSELVEMTKSFREKSVMSESLRMEIEKLTHYGHRSDYLETLTNSTILTEDDWLQFRQLFEKAYPGFIDDQKIRCPKITPAKLRYLLLGKLHLNTKEMANMLGISPSAVRKTRARLQKKMEN